MSNISNKPKGVPLDIDETHMLKSLVLSDRKDDEFTEFLKNVEKLEQPSVVVRPVPGVCVKIKDANNSKIFLNICTTPEIPPPMDISDKELLEVLEEDEPSYRIPMSIGYERQELDKIGIPCPIYDIVLHPSFLKKCLSNSLFWSFMMDVVIQGVAHKFNKSIDPKEVILLKNRKVMGTLQDHKIEKREVKSTVQKPLIEELSVKPDKTVQTDLASEQLDTRQSSCSKVQNIQKPEHIIFIVSGKEEAAQLVGMFKLTDALVEDISLDVGENRIIVSYMKTGYFVDVVVPYKLQKDKVDALYDRGIGVLQVNMPVL